MNAEICERALTLLRDDRNQVPLKVGKDANVLYLSVIDYPSGWREGVPSRTFVPALKKRWPNVTALEISDKTTPSELDMVKVLARRADAVVAGVFVRIASFSGRMDLSAQACRCSSRSRPTSRNRSSRSSSATRTPPWRCRSCRRSC